MEKNYLAFDSIEQCIENVQRLFRRQGITLSYEGGKLQILSRIFKTKINWLNER